MYEELIAQRRAGQHVEQGLLDYWYEREENGRFVNGLNFAHPAMETIRRIGTCPQDCAPHAGRR